MLSRSERGRPEYHAARQRGVSARQKPPERKFIPRPPSPFPRPVLDACYKAAMELYTETSAKNAKFKKVHDHYMAFLENQVLWFRVTEATYDSFMQTGRRSGGGAAAPKKS